MTPESWRRVEELFAEVADLDPAERRAVLDRACGDDRQIREEVEALVASDRQGDLVDQAIRSEARGLLETVSTPALGHRFGAWVTTRLLGQGGMSTVYLAVRADHQFRKEVALKVLKRGMETAGLVQRFDTERHILARLEHPNIARLIDAGTSGEGVPFFVMERVDGVAIDRYCDRERLGIEARLELFAAVCEAVAYAHQNLIVHRDLKPSNILVTAAGVPKLLDFGIAKLLSDETAAERVAESSKHERLMTPGYASPEQVAGDPITTASDVYSLGVLLFELLCGRRPHLAAASASSELARQLREEPPAPSAAVDEAAVEVAARRGLSPARLRQRLAGDLDAVALRALDPDPQQRYPSPELLAADLRRHLELLPIAARRRSFRYVGAKFLRRHRLGVAAAAFMTLALAGFVTVLILLSIRLAQQRQIAERERGKAEKVSEFLVDIFQVSDPEGGRGATVTARELLASGAERVTEDLAGEPELQAQLMFTIGRVYQQLGLYPSAAPLLEEALEIRRQELGPVHPDIAASLNQLAILRVNQGTYQRAEHYFREALELRRRLYGDRHEMVSASLNNLALVLHDQGKYRDAEALYREALDMDVELSGPDDPQTVIARDNLGLLLHDLGSHAEAEAQLQLTLELSRRHFGERHPNVAMSLMHLGAAEVALGRSALGERRIEEALEIFREVLGPDHPEAGRALQRLAEARLAGGDAAAARALHEEALALRRKSLGEEHPEVAASLTGLGQALEALGESAAAAARLEQAVGMYRRTLPPTHPELAVALLDLGRLIQAGGDPARAEPLVEESLEIRRRALPEADRRTVEAETLLAEIRAARP